MQQIEPVIGEKKLACAGSVAVGREPPAALVLSGDTTVSRFGARAVTPAQKRVSWKGK
jgi:hypothetical protein